MLDFIEVNTQSSIRIEDEKIIYADPIKIPSESHDADIILITHAHYDHYSVDDIKKVMKNDTVIICPKLMDEADDLGIDVKKVMPNEKFEVSGIEFETIPAYNKLKPFHPKSNGWVGYIINSKQNGRIYISGDTDVTAENQQVKCRIALVAIGGHFTMNAQQAAGLVNTIKPEFAIPTHYGSIVGKPEDADVFSKNVDNGINVVIKLKQ